MVNDNTYILLNKECEKINKNLGKVDLREFYTITYDGHKFNVLPFLISSLKFHSEDDYIHSLHKAVSSEYNGELVTKYTFGSDLCDINVVDSIIQHYRSDGLVELCLWLNNTNPVKLARILHRAMNLLVSDMINGKADVDYLKFNCKSICNTQAFSYFLGAYWVLKKSPKLMGLLKQEVKSLGLKAILDELCPKDSLHYKYISGEITGQELKKQYFESDAHILETMSLLTDGLYTGEEITDMDRLVAEDTKIFFYRFDSLIKLNKYLALTTIRNDVVEDLKKENEKLKLQCDDYYSQITDRVKIVNEKQRKIDELKELNNNLEKECKNYKNTISNMSTDDKLQLENKELKEEIKTAQNNEIELLQDKFELKQLISSQKKKIKKLEAKLESLDLPEVEIQEIEQDNEVEITVDEAIEFIKDKQIVIVGGLGISSYDKRLEEKGLNNITWTNKHNLFKGDYDIGVILTNNVKHCTVRQLEKDLKNTPIIYFNGVNIDMLIMEIYKELVA